ncbi:MAG: hypothetical protein NVS4B13_03880 [Candidatus Elarobacter sp.]
MNRTLSLLALGVTVALGGCSTSGNTAVPPAQRVADLSQNKLQFAVGTSNFNGSLGLNTVVTYRQPNGLDGTLLNTPTITGPAGFVNTGSPGFDKNTNTIAGSPQPDPVGTAPRSSTFGTAGGAFAYGFQPNNSNSFGSANFSRYALPFFAPGGTGRFFIGGPPAYPNVRNGTEPASSSGVPFQGFPFGFTNFNLTPVLGTYTLSLVVPTGFDASSRPTTTTVTAAGTLSSLAALPVFPAPAVAFDGTGGATVSVVVPPGVTEALIEIVNITGGCYPAAEFAPAYFTFRTTSSGPQTFTLANNLGPTFGPQTSTPTICTAAQNTAVARAVAPSAPPQPQDSVRVYAVGFNYSAFGAGPPNSSSPTPPIVGANGQADLTQSGAVVYPTPPPTGG